MKKVVKQPFFWISACSFIIAIAIAIISTIADPELSVLKNMEKAYNKNDIQAIISCYPPEIQTEMRGLLTTFGGAADYFDMEKGEQINILSGPVVTDEDGDKSVHVFIISNIYDIFSDFESTALDLVEVNGKLYLAE